MNAPKKADGGAFPVGALRLLPGALIDESPTDMAWVAAENAPTVAGSEAADRDRDTDEA